MVRYDPASNRFVPTPGPSGVGLDSHILAFTGDGCGGAMVAADHGVFDYDAARYGGEGIAILFADATPQAAWTTTERLCGEIVRTSIDAHGVSVVLTLSGGHHRSRAKRR